MTYDPYNPYVSQEGAPVGDGPRVLIVDDSAPSRAALAEVLEQGGCEVVGRAMDGAMALRMALEEEPDVITCDLEMPRMDGFTFLRILQTMKAIPVIVVTSDARPEAALQALELGARDFVVKPGKGGPVEVKRLGTQLLSRVRALARAKDRVPQWPAAPEVPIPADVKLVVVGTSTGGPRALRDLLGRMPRRFKAPLLIAQHMPPRFTAAFADRLKRQTGIDVAEARDGDLALPSQVRVAPGGQHLRVAKDASGRLVMRIAPPVAGDRYVPSVDHLFDSAASTVGAQTLGVVLTGMGKDGAVGAVALRAAGAPMWTESPLTAAIDGMPTAALKAHGAAASLPLDELATLLAKTLDEGESKPKAT